MRSVSIDRREFVMATGAAAVLGVALPSRTVGQEATPDPIDLPDLAITAVDYAFELPASAEAGWTHVIMDNQGMMDHHAMFLRPREGSTIEDVQAALVEGNLGAIFATAYSAGGTNAGPGHQASVAMNLEAGQYLLICAVPNEEGIPHFALGMQAVLEVTEGADDGTPPEADATVHLVDMAFEGLPTDATVGAHVWDVANTGTQLHELVILQLAEGVTIEQGMQIFSEPAAASPVASPAAGPPQGPPFAAIGGVAALSPGESHYA